MGGWHGRVCYTAAQRHLSDQARRTLSLADTGEAGCAECLAVAAEMQQFMVVATTGLLDLSDRTEAIGDRRCAAELFETAMMIEDELLRDAPPVTIG